MPRPKRGKRLGGSPSHQRKILSNLTVSLIEHEQVTTTHAKAKVLRPYAAKVIIMARRGDLDARSSIVKKIENNDAITKLFDDIAPRYEDRPGGYLRIIKLGPRRGDGAEMAKVELV